MSVSDQEMDTILCLVTCRTSCGAVCADAVPDETAGRGAVLVSPLLGSPGNCLLLGISITRGSSGLSMPFPSVARVTLAGTGVIR